MHAGFTLAEVLVALALVALVVPVIVKCLNISTLAGEVSQRKAVAMRVAEKVLNETIVTGQWNAGSQKGTENGGKFQMQYTVRNEPWTAIGTAVNVGTANGLNQNVVNQNTLHLISVDVNYPAQGRSYAVHLSTVVDVSRQVTINPPPKE
jgi:type II secretion system protein I